MMMLTHILDKGSTYRDVSRAAEEIRSMRYLLDGSIYEILDYGIVKIREHKIITPSKLELQLLRAESGRDKINFPESIGVTNSGLYDLTFLEYVDMTLASSNNYLISERDLSEADEINKLKELPGQLYKLSRLRK
jgi:hypothetical protein